MMSLSTAAGPSVVQMSIEEEEESSPAAQLEALSTDEEEEDEEESLSGEEEPDDYGDFAKRRPLTADQRDKFLRLVKTQGRCPAKKEYKFPVVNGRAFRPQWAADWNWLLYCKKTNGAFCFFCLPFGTFYGVGRSQVQAKLFASTPWKDFAHANQVRLHSLSH